MTDAQTIAIAVMVLIILAAFWCACMALRSENRAEARHVARDGGRRYGGHNRPGED